MFTVPSLVSLGIVAGYHLLAHSKLGGKLFGLLGRVNPLAPSAGVAPSTAPVKAPPVAAEVSTGVFHGLIKDAVSKGVQDVIANVQQQVAAGQVPTSLGAALKTELGVLVQSAVSAAIADLKPATK